MLLATEDWFVLSHFRPLVRALVAACGDVVIVTTSSGRLAEIEALGARVVALDFARASLEAGRQMSVVGRLRAVIRAEAPAVVHAISLKPVAIGGLALRGLGGGLRPHLVMHLTGTGPVGSLMSGKVPASYAATLVWIKWLMSRPRTSLIVENPDDAARIAGPGWASDSRVLVLGGAGVDPLAYTAPQRPVGDRPVAGYLGRMLWTKGVGTLVEAQEQLLRQDVDLELRMGGTPDHANRWSIPLATLEQWALKPAVTYLGQVPDAAEFWRQTDIAVVPSTWGEGMPRVLLEAAACARPLIVSDVPGCRHFVRHEQEGLIVPPGDPAALAAALARLVADPALAKRLGDAARQRLLDGFTEDHVRQAITADYSRILQN